MNEKRPPCKGFLTYSKLLEEASKGKRNALECLGKVIIYEIIPSFKRRFPKLRIEDIEEIAWAALLEFLTKINDVENGKYNIGLLWRIVKLRVLDFLRKIKSAESNLDIDDLQNISEFDADEGNYEETAYRHVSEEDVFDFIKELKKILTDEEEMLFDLHIVGTKIIEEVKELTNWSNGNISRMKKTIEQKAEELIEKTRKGLL